MADHEFVNEILTNMPTICQIVGNIIEALEMEYHWSFFRSKSDLKSNLPSCVLGVLRLSIGCVNRQQSLHLTCPCSCFTVHHHNRRPDLLRYVLRGDMLERLRCPSVFCSSYPMDSDFLFPIPHFLLSLYLQSIDLDCDSAC